jgi:hypothetical protein
MFPSVGKTAHSAVFHSCVGAATAQGGSPPIRPRTRRLTSGVRGRLTALNELRQHDGADAYD